MVDFDKDLNESYEKETAQIVSRMEELREKIYDEGKPIIKDALDHGNGISKFSAEDIKMGLLWGGVDWWIDLKTPDGDDHLQGKFTANGEDCQLKIYGPSFENFIAGKLNATEILKLNAFKSLADNLDELREKLVDKVLPLIKERESKKEERNGILQKYTEIQKKRDEERKKEKEASIKEMVKVGAKVSYKSIYSNSRGWHRDEWPMTITKVSPKTVTLTHESGFVKRFSWQEMIKMINKVGSSKEVEFI